MKMQEKLSNVDSEKERWNYKPSGKVELNPMFARPFKIRAIFRLVCLILVSIIDNNTRIYFGSDSVVCFLSFSIIF